MQYQNVQSELNRKWAGQVLNTQPAMDAFRRDFWTYALSEAGTYLRDQAKKEELAERAISDMIREYSQRELPRDSMTEVIVKVSLLYGKFGNNLSGSTGVGSAGNGANTFSGMPQGGSYAARTGQATYNTGAVPQNSYGTVAQPGTQSGAYAGTGWMQGGPVSGGMPQGYPSQTPTSWAEPVQQTQGYSGNAWNTQGQTSPTPAPPVFQGGYGGAQIPAQGNAWGQSFPQQAAQPQPAVQSPVQQSPVQPVMQPLYIQHVQAQPQTAAQTVFSQAAQPAQPVQSPPVMQVPVQTNPQPQTFQAVQMPVQTYQPVSGQTSVSQSNMGTVQIPTPSAQPAAQAGQGGAPGQNEVWTAASVQDIPSLASMGQSPEAQAIFAQAAQLLSAYNAVTKGGQVQIPVQDAVPGAPTYAQPEQSPGIEISSASPWATQPAETPAQPAAAGRTAPAPQPQAQVSAAAKVTEPKSKESEEEEEEGRSVSFSIINTILLILTVASVSFLIWETGLIQKFL